MSDHIFIQGKVFIGDRDGNGKGINISWGGDADEFKVSLATEKAEIKESYSGNNLTVASVQRGSSATGTVNFREAKINNLVFALQGAKAIKAAGTVGIGSPETIAAAGVVEGELVTFANQNVSDVVLSADGVVIADTKYTVNAKHGSVEFNEDVAGVITATYAFGASTQVKMFTATPADKFVRFEGMNLVNNKRVVVELYKVRFAPLSELSMIGNDFGALSMSFDVLADLNQSAGGDLGQFGRIIYID